MFYAKHKIIINRSYLSNSSNKMGSNKSKPVKESARTVLARRKKDVIENNMTMPSTISSPTQSSPSSISTPSTSSSTLSMPSIPSSSSISATGQNTIDRINNYRNVSKIIGPNDGLDLDPKILKTIDKWVLKEEQVKYPGSDTNKDQMATILRLEEEKSILQETGKMPLHVKGRLTEEQLNKFYERIQENNIEKCNDEILSNEFNMPINTVIMLKKIARLPNIYMDGWGEIKDQKVSK